MRFDETIGNTPLVDLKWDPDGRSPELCRRRVRLLAKVEGYNPGGSAKDRSARAMVLGAEARGELRPGMTVLEATSGNTGVALAMIATSRGYRVELVMPDTATPERVQLMKAYGATVTPTPGAAGMPGALEHARARSNQPDVLLLDQFSNEDNPRAHYETTGPEIWHETAGKVTHVVCAMGTTGTLVGISRALKERNPAVCVIGVQPDPHAKIPGLVRWSGTSYPRIFEPHLADRIVEVGQTESELEAARLVAQEALLVGPSGGAASLIARRICASLVRGTVVCILCDRGDRYLSTPLFAAA